MHTSIKLIVPVAATILVACGSEIPDPNAPHPADQVAWGEQLFAQVCAECHGNQGQGRHAPALVGKAALPLDPPKGAKLRKTQFHTAQDVFDFTKRTMPPDHAGQLSDAQVQAILAFDLKANGVDLAGKNVDATTLPTFVLHP